MSDESYWAVISCGIAYYAVLLSLGIKSYRVYLDVSIQMSKLLSSTFLWPYKSALASKSEEVTTQMKAIEQYFLVVMFYYALQVGSNFTVFE